MLLLMVSGMSLMYMRKNHGPETEPCGTLDRTGQESEYSLSRTVLLCLLGKNDCVHVVTVVLMPSRWSFSRSL